MMTHDTPAIWFDRADIAQESLDHYFATDWPQYLANNHPHDTGDTDTFNYWWLAHVIDTRIDAWERTGNEQWLEKAAKTAENIVIRNNGQLFNDYFDDMLWFALALVRLHDATGDGQYLRDAENIWDHVVEHGWNETHGASLAWRKQQLYYKNTPANGPLVILSLRLDRRSLNHEGSGRDYRGYARTAFDWLTVTLVGADGFVEDGINRERDGRVDTQWRFTYNQGLYLGAAAEMFLTTGEHSYLDRAAQTGVTAIRQLSDGRVFRDEGTGGDEGLFKGVYFRYLGQLIPLLDSSSDSRAELERFVRESTDVLWANCVVGSCLRGANDWSRVSNAPIPYSTQLSAVMATEERSRLEHGSAGNTEARRIEERR